MLRKIKCIYSLECIVTNKIYIGQTQDFNRRKREHLSKLNRNIHSNKNLQDDWNKYSPEKFKWSILEEIEDDEVRLFKETYYMNLYGGINSSSIYNELDINHLSILTKQKIKTNNAMTGNHHTQETKKKLSESHKGKNSNKNNPMFGKHHSKEVKEQISIKMSHKNNPMFGKRKYNSDFINQLRSEKQQSTYKSLGEKYNIHPDIISNLIRFGTPNHKNKYKYYEEE